MSIKLWTETWCLMWSLGYGISLHVPYMFVYVTICEFKMTIKLVCHYHSKGRKSSYYQPQNIEQGVKVDIVGDEKDHAMAKETIAL